MDLLLAISAKHQNATVLAQALVEAARNLTKGPPADNHQLGEVLLECLLMLIRGNMSYSSATDAEIIN